MSDTNEYVESLDSGIEHLENQSRQNNVKIIGVAEDSNEKMWDDTEAKVHKLLKEKLDITEDVQIER